MAKPRGQAYDEFLRGVADASAVWSRMMVLGPAPEFAIERSA